MGQNSIFIDNFYERNVTLGVVADDDKTERKFIVGLHESIDSKEVRQKVVSEIFKALLLHDTVIFRTNHILDIVFAFGISDTTKLVKTGRFQFIDDLGYNIVLSEDSLDKYSLTEIRFASKNGESKSSLEWLEGRLSSEQVTRNELNALLLNVESCNKTINIDQLAKNTFEETRFDLKNGNISDYLHISTSSIHDIRRIDAYNLLRLGNLNRSLLFASMLGVENINLDGKVQPILGVKLSPRLNLEPNVNSFDSLFLDIFKKKNIPDLGSLYISEIISIEDYLKIISSLSGSKFRQWLKEKEYNKNEVEKDFLSSTASISNKYLKFIRWCIPNAIGLILPPASSLGISFADSFILDKLMSGWHPNLFVDDTLKEKIDSKINLHVKKEKENLIKVRFPNVNRNDLCPCGSKIKFKKCCGKQ